VLRLREGLGVARGAIGVLETEEREFISSGVKLHVHLCDGDMVSFEPHQVFINFEHRRGSAFNGEAVLLLSALRYQDGLDLAPFVADVLNEIGMYSTRLKSTESFSKEALDMWRNS
jgi:hypothetical protein